MRIRALLVLCGLCLAAAGFVSAQSGLEFVPRFTRLLKQDLSSVASYLVPTEQPTLCANNNGNCCQADSYASPYGLTYVNSTQQLFGGRTYTTFFYQFHSNHLCNAGLDDAQCCTASADNIWVDVDPTLKVKYVSFNGQRLANTEQGEFGLKLGSVNLRVDDAKNSIPVAVTVEGAADSLCPPPGLAPIPGLCELVVQGATSANPNACCPTTITVSNLQSNFVPPAGSAFQCAASLDNSPFKLEFEGVSAAQTVAGQQYVSYNFRLIATGSCRADGVHDCCHAQLSYLDMKVTDLGITAVQLDGKSVGFSTSSWNEPNTASYRSLVVDNLNLVADDLGAVGLPLTVTVRLSADSNPGKDLCDSSSDLSQGGCAYYLHSEDGFCCPSGLALPTSVVPPVPPGTCNPPTNVPASESSMSLAYYEKTCSSSSTTFNFLLANHNDAACKYGYCADVCTWSLYLDPSVASQVAVGHELAVNNGKQVITPGNVATGTLAALTFTYGPAGASTTNFYVTLPASAQGLSALCARNALPGQGNKACAAVVRSKNVYTMVFFDETDVFIKPADGSSCTSGSPPPAPACSNPKPLADSCLAVRSARYNTMSASAVFDFALVPADASATCVPPSPPGRNVDVQIQLSAAAVDQISTRGQVRPKANLALDRTSGATWTVTSTTAATSLSFEVQGPLSLSDVCRQGVSPDQPANSCVVEVTGDNGCFRGYVSASADGRLIWVSEQESRSRGVDAAVVVPAVVVPAVVLLLALLVLAAWYRRRRSQKYATSVSSGSAGDLNRPLAAGSLRDDLSVPSASPSDVQIRVPGASQGGAAAPGGR
ncbi:hypothetical protein CHLRE_02g077550v5 [Chlamydomonas reinhardtii]|uniref:Pherophorin domain-containing protein n=1 Tax=Chlamydomonas reinhardtii TaxID=3055 RepID=A8IA98_CHLRE|nr:uncharacterized protein CHLRE_02g077550v5 [Chlamydomonas reinhardtii]XP_042926806.1 uncharacterized protein CHLRE_02g077550v5 [Chlamydomonas reinhardtii]PNW86215.1 hypothetical protein CHLRE_02g077550v5 [Chlamydomonas reinhardtii]PNW86216.1 hypothetical protein CHLRE_02g077550v5 [Chlamydomonas reinhardtii]|eukprot:XP_001701651.1 predicted protein [Chlamydomonas reinhardtii]